MRIIRTFVLRLLMDAEEPERLRGSLRSILDDSEYPFADGQMLLGLLRRLGTNADARDELSTPQRKDLNDNS